MRKGNGWRGARRYLAAVDTRPRVPVTGDDDRRALSPDEIHERRDALAGRARERLHGGIQRNVLPVS